jgi:hypothetical protein
MRMGNRNISALSITPIAGHIRKQEAPTNGQKLQKCLRITPGYTSVWYAVTSLDITINIYLLHKTAARYTVCVETYANLYRVKKFRVIQGIKFLLSCLTEPDREPNSSQAIHSTFLKTSFLRSVILYHIPFIRWSFRRFFSFMFTD